MIQFINGNLHIIDTCKRFGDPSDPSEIGELLESVLAAAELCLNTDESYAPDAAILLRLASLLVPPASNFQTARHDNIEIQALIPSL